MARLRPQDLDALRHISGVGDKKREQYGDDFLEIIRRHPLPALLNNDLSDTVNQSLALLHEGCDAEAIAARRGLSVSSVYNHLAEAIEAGVLPLAEAVTLQPAQHRQILNAFELYHEDGKLKPVYDALEQAYDYGVLRCVQADASRRVTRA